MYDYDRRTAAARAPGYDYQRVMSSLTQDVVKKTVALVSTALHFADQALRSLKFNEELDHDEIEKVEQPLASLARWMLSRREAEAEPVAQFAKLTSDLSELTSFWNRPLFLNRDKHAEKIEAIYKKMRKVKDEIAKAFRQSGAWKTTAPSF